MLQDKFLTPSLEHAIRLMVRICRVEHQCDRCKEFIDKGSEMVDVNRSQRYHLECHNARFFWNHLSSRKENEKVSL